MLSLYIHRRITVEKHDPLPLRKSPSYGFTLIEILVAVTILAFMTGILASISGHATALWMRNESQSQVRERARTALDYIANDLRQVVMPLSLDTANPALQRGPQLLISPAALDSGANGQGYNHPNSIFWFAPVATSHVRGDLAIVGYFIRMDVDGKYRLCRYFVNPDSPNYKATPSDGPNDWLADTLLDAVAPGDASHDYRGLVFENVLGLWVTAYDAKNDVITTAIDTRISGKLPARIEISLVFLDDRTAEKTGAGIAVPSSKSYTSAESYISNLPPALKAVAGIATTSVNFKDRQ